MSYVVMLFWPLKLGIAGQKEGKVWCVLVGEAKAKERARGEGRSLFPSLGIYSFLSLYLYLYQGGGVVGVERVFEEKMDTLVS